MFMAFSNDRRAAIKKLKLLAFGPRNDVDSFREKIEETFACPILPNHVEFLKREYGGVACDVLSPEIYSSKRIVIYIHGGSFVGGSCASWREFCSMIAHKSFSRVVVPEFSLAPENKFPKAVEEIKSVFRVLFTEELVTCLLDADPNNKNPRPDVIIAADSSGASIALSFLFNLEEKYYGMINRFVLISPWLNFSDDAAAMTAKKNADEIISSEVLRKSAEAYVGADVNFSNEAASPALAHIEKLKNLPPIFIQMGEKEITLPDVRDFAARVKEAGGICKIEVTPNMMFMFQMADEYLHEAHDAFDRLGEVISGIDDKTGASIIENSPVLEHSILSES